MRTTFKRLPTLRSHRVLFVLAAVLLTTVVLLSSPPSEAFASCSGAGCNGLNPLIAGCTGDTTILATKDLTDWNEWTLATLTVVYSNDCGTVYAEVSSWFDYTDLYAEITSNNIAYGAYGSGLSVMSPMIYDTNPSGASGVGTVSVYEPTYSYASGNVVAP